MNGVDCYSRKGIKLTFFNTVDSETETRGRKILSFNFRNQKQKGQEEIRSFTSVSLLTYPLVMQDATSLVLKIERFDKRLVALIVTDILMMDRTYM